ncbi:hypothetical protein ACFL6U_13670 [Planctomycetota bacterium]
MNRQPLMFLGLECINDGSYFQIRLHKPNVAHIGRCVREFLLVTCTLALMSVFTVAPIVWVATTVAEADSLSIQDDSRSPHTSFSESHNVDRHRYSESEFYTLNGAQYYGETDYTDPRLNP